MLHGRLVGAVGIMGGVGVLGGVGGVSRTGGGWERWDGPRLTYSAIADNPEGGQAAKVIAICFSEG